MKMFSENKKFFDIIFVCILFLTSFCYFLYGLPYFNLRNYLFDEAISAYGAVRILAGGMPYQDFWTFHAPGRFYILAAIFKIFGTHLKVVILFVTFILSLTTCGIYKFVSRMYSKTFGLFAFLLTLAWLKFYMVYVRPGQFAILFYIFCWFPLLSYISSGKSKCLIIMGILTGIIGFFRMDFAAYNFISLFLIILFKKITGPEENRWKIKINSILKDEFYLLLGFLLVFLPNFIFFVTNGGFKEFKDYVLSGIRERNRHLPFPTLKATTLIFYLPLLIFLLSFIKLLFYDLKNKTKDNIFWLSLFFIFSGSFLYYYTTRRIDIPHLLPTMIPTIILFISLYYIFIKRLHKFAYFYRYFVWSISFFISFWLLLYSIRPYYKELRRISKEGEKGKLDIPRASGLYDFSDSTQSQVAAIKYIQSKTDKDEKIFAGNLRHDNFVYNDVMFYFLSERHSGTKYYQFEPGFTNAQRIQGQIILDLIKNNVKYIILWRKSEEINEPNESNKSSGIRDLDNFIQKNYKIEKIFDDYLILKRG